MQGCSTFAWVFRLVARSAISRRLSKRSDRVGAFTGRWGASTVTVCDRSIQFSEWDLYANQSCTVVLDLASDGDSLCRESW